MEENKLNITGINSNGFGIIAKLVMQDRNLSLRFQYIKKHKN